MTTQLLPTCYSASRCYDKCMDRLLITRKGLFGLLVLEVWVCDGVGPCDTTVGTRGKLFTLQPGSKKEGTRVPLYPFKGLSQSDLKIPLHSTSFTCPPPPIAKQETKLLTHESWGTVTTRVMAPLLTSIRQQLWLLTVVFSGPLHVSLHISKGV